jgi:Carbohydrate binding module (family 35)/Viral BACON domain/Secretion system C-terminal sorting domain
MKKMYTLWCMVILMATAILPNSVWGQTKYEAESASLTGVAAATSHTGYSGSGYVDGFDNAADKITFTVNVPTAGTYPLVIRYSGPYGEKFQTLQVNGTTVSSCGVQFLSNANWADKAYGNITLNAGNNTITIVSCYGWFQVDYITVGTVPPPTTTKYEAESAVLTGTTVANTSTGYSGTGYVTSLDNTGDKITFTVNVATAGSYPLTFRYQNSCGVCEKFQDIKINSAAVVNTQFNATATGWSDKSFGNVTLNAGNNTIEISKSWGFTDFDYITVGPGGGGGNTLTISPSSLSVGSGAGSSNIAVTANVSWTVSDDQTWITVSPTSGSNNGTVAVAVTANTASTSRSGTVTITGGSITRTVTVTQAGVSTSPPGAMTPGANFWNIGWEGWQDFFVPGLNWATTTNPWNPTLISELQAAKIKCLRFMDWNSVNSSSVVNWSQRIPKTANHYNVGNTIPCFVDNYDGATNTHHLVPNATTENGVAIEWQIDLCNRVGADIWINIPCTANADYSFQLANLLNSQLNSNLKIYVEWANEIWNWGTPATVYANDQAATLGLGNIDVGAFADPWRKYNIYASVRMFEQFARVFGANNSRIVKVIGGQVGYHWDGFDFNHMVTGDLACLNNNTINPNHTTVNAFAMAPYMGGSTIAAQRSAINTGVQQMTWAKNSLNGTGLSLVCYEGGADNYPDNSLALTRDPAQEQLYIDYLTALAPLCGGVFNQYCFYGGPWGLKNTAGESTTIAPKWRGWIAYWNAHAARIAGSTTKVTVQNETVLEKGLRIYPNPVNTRTLTTQIFSATDAVGQISLISSSGQKVIDIQRTFVKGSNSIQIPVAQVKNGVYFLIINKGSEQIVKKVVINK